MIIEIYEEMKAFPFVSVVIKTNKHAPGTGELA